MRFLCFIGMHIFKSKGDKSSTYRRHCVECDFDRDEKIKRRDKIKRKKYNI